MLLKNKTTKVIGVGVKTLMPEGMEGDSADVSKEVAELPAIKLFIQKGFIEAMPDKKPSKPKEKPVAEVSEDEAVDTAEEKKPAKRAPRKPKEPVAE